MTSSSTRVTTSTPTPKPQTAPYIIQSGDTYPSIAEARGQSGHWQMIVELNPPPPPQDPPLAWLDPGSPVAGVTIQLPAAWTAQPS